MKAVKIHPYNPAWPTVFGSEAANIKSFLGEHCVALHHIGSTSVPGLIAKEDLDILCVVDRLESSLLLRNHAFVFKGEINIPLRYFFSKNDGTSKVNLHVVEADHGFIALNLSFRDYLRSHDEARDAYARLKEELVGDVKNFEKINSRFTGYGLGKDDFIKSVLRKAGFDGFMMNFCAHHNEWAFYHRIMKSDSRSHCHLVLYKGTKIVAAAHVEFLTPRDAIIRQIATESHHEGRAFEVQMATMLKKWLGNYGVAMGGL